MKWFKHISDSGDDQDIDDAVALFGPDGYYVFFRTLEIMAREFKIDSPGRNSFTKTFFFKKFRSSGRKVTKVLTFYNQRERIFFSVSDEGRLGTVSLYCPKLKDLCDEWTRKRDKKTPE